MVYLNEIFLNNSSFLLKKMLLLPTTNLSVGKKGGQMLEIDIIDSSITPIYQIDTQRSKVNPFAPVDNVVEKTSQKTEENAKVNNVKTASELIELFSLSEPSNKIKVLSKLNYSQQLAIIDLLNPESKVLGMKLYSKEKILNMLFETSQEQISNVLVGALPMKKIFEFIPEEFLNRFFLSDQLEKKNFTKAFEQYSQEELIKFMENLTGIPMKGKDKAEMLQMLERVPLEVLQPNLLAIKPEQKILLISKMMEANKPEEGEKNLFTIFSKGQLMMPLDKIDKEQILKGFNNLNTNLVGNMLSQLPNELMPLLLSMVDTEALSNMLINQFSNVITEAFGDM